MAKLITSATIEKDKSHFPSHYIQLLLSILGAIPRSFHKPYMPNLKLSESTFLYCVLFYGLTLWSSAESIMYCVKRMESAYPYNHFRYIAAFELCAAQLLHLVTLVSWIDTPALDATLDAWNQFIIKYETVFRKPIPDCKNREIFLQLVIVVSSPVAWFTGSKLLEPEIHAEWKYFPSMVFSGIIQLSFVLHWLSYFWTIEEVSQELQKHLLEADVEHLITPKLLADYRALWILLRNIIDKISKRRIPLYVSLFQSSLATMSIFESILLYLKTRNVFLTGFNLGISAFTVVPLVLSCFAAQNAANQVEYLFEDLMTNLELSSISKTAQKEICMIYLLKRAKTPTFTLFGYIEVNLSLLLSVASSITLYILILIQFEQMRR